MGPVQTISRRFMVAAGAAALSTVLLSSCMKEVRLTPQSRAESVEALPMSVKIEVSNSVSAGKMPIVFDLKQAAVGYFKNRGTFREVAQGGADAVLKISSRFSLGSEMSFHYDFDLQSTLQGGGRLLGSYRVKCSAVGGKLRLTSEADREPMNRALTDCLDDLASQIEANGPTLLAKMRGSLQDPAPAAAPSRAEQPFQRTSDVDRPTYRRPENPDDFALVIGIERYQNLPAADFAERDANAVREHLLALGYPERNIIFLIGSKASRTGIEKYVETWLPLNIKDSSSLVVYYSGHGAPDAQDGQAYLVPWDGDAKFLKNTGYPLKRLYASLNGLKAKQVLIAMDACFTGEGGRSVLAKGARPLVTKVDVGMAGKGKLVVLAAAAADEITATHEGEGHGLFTYFFLKGLEARKGRASAKELFDYLLPHVQDGARREGRDQTPQLIGAQAGAFSL